MFAMRSAFVREVLRSVRGSLGRFLAIMGIVALGCGFYAGLQASGPDMRLAADRYYDGTNLWDLRVISTLGFGDDDLRRLSSVGGVGALAPSRTVDALARLSGEQVAVRISTVDTEAAERSVTVADGTAVSSADKDYLNRPLLREGRWPSAADECVVSADATGDGGVGVGDAIEVLYGTDQLDELLEVRRFTVVGTVSSSNYPYTGNLGSTSLGSGKIEQYLYVSPSAFKEDAAYTEAYLKVTGADELASESDAYFDLVGRTKGAIEHREQELAAARQDDLKASAQRTLDEKVAQYESRHAETYGELDASKARLDDAQAEIDDGEAQLVAGEALYQEGLARYQGEKDAAEERLSQAQGQLDQARAQLDQERASWEVGVGQLLAATGATSLAEARSVLAAQLEQAAAGVTQAEDALEQLEAALATAQEQGDVAAQAQLQAQLDATRDQLGGLRAAQGQAADALAQADQLVAASQQLDAGQDQLDAGRDRLDGQRAAADTQLEDARAQLDAAAARLRSSRRELSEARERYQEGLARYEEGRAEADERFGEAWRQIQDAQAEIDGIERPDLYVLDRSQSEGAATYHADSERIDHIAQVFPFIFFLVAALVALTTMTRMIEDDRIQIGTYKALGYGTARIASKYLSYAALAAGVGAVVGIAVLTQALPHIIMSSYSIIYAVPRMALPLPVDASIAFSAGGLGVGVTLLATWFAVVSTLREAPATLMLPRAPKAGKRILLERIGALWRRLSFNWKVTFRNLFRYKRRFLMTVIGISGCTALLLVGFGLHDSIWDIIDRQFGPIVHYDTTIGLSGSANELDVSDVVSYLESAGGVNGIVRVQTENMQASGIAGTTSGAATGTTGVTVVVPQDSQEISRAVTLRDRVSGAEAAFGDDSVLLTEKLASLYGVGPGDKIVLFDQDDVGNPRGSGHELTVTGVVENYVGNLVYMGREAWSEVDPSTPVFGTVYASTACDEGLRQRISERLHDMTDVSTVIFSTETIATYRDMLSVVDLIVVVLIVSAAALAFIVLYNLTNINVEERIREIASLKVLGFTRGEVYAYVFREVALLAVIGDAFGMLLGIWLENFVITTAEVDYVMFGRTIHAPSFVYAFALTLAFTLLVLLIMRRKLDRVDMVESLKSVD